MLTGMHIVMYGNPVDGLQFFGPFKTGEDAALWAGAEIDDTWWIAPLGHPDEFSGEDEGATPTADAPAPAPTAQPAEPETQWRNHYECDRCGTAWDDEWSCQCDDDCPSCGRTCSPHESEEIAG